MTEHKPLLSFFSEKKPIPTMAFARIQRWALTLAAYKRTTPVPTENVWKMELLNATPVGVKEIENGARSDIVLSRVIKCVQHAWPS